MKADAFRMVEILAAEDLAEHPVWADYLGDPDSEWIRSFGVSEERLEAELARYDYCGRAALFPVLTDKLPERANLVVAVHFPGGEDLDITRGYRIGDHALGLFAAGQEVCLNRHMQSRSEASLEKLAAALGASREQLMALRYEARGDDRQILHDASGAPISGSLRDFL